MASVVYIEHIAMTLLNLEIFLLVNNPKSESPSTSGIYGNCRRLCLLAVCCCISCSVAALVSSFQLHLFEAYRTALDSVPLASSSALLYSSERQSQLFLDLFLFGSCCFWLAVFQQRCVAWPSIGAQQ